jgi:AcrR family transcriptional regulator
MPKNKPTTDRRVQKTKIALRDAMLALMVPKGWDDMSIQEICDRANVGRSTFYTHYQSKDELLSEGLNGLRDMLATQAMDGDGAGFHFLCGLLDHMAQQREVFKAAIGRRSGHGMARRFKEMVEQLVEIELKKRQHPAAKNLWLARYLAGGIVEVMAWWVDTARPPSIKEMERRLNELSLAALGAGFT